MPAGTAGTMRPMDTTQPQPPAAPTRVEVITNTDPDGERTVIVFLDGVNITGTPALVVENVDPRDGEDLATWQARTEELRTHPEHSAAFREALAAERSACDTSDYLDGSDEADEERLYEVHYEILTTMTNPPEVAFKDSIHVGGTSEHTAAAAAREWVRYNSPYYDERIDPVINVTGISEA